MAPKNKLSAAARLLSAKGAAAGGRARSAKMTARERLLHARKMAKARWVKARIGGTER